MIRRLQPGEAAIFRAIRLEALRAEPANFASSVLDWEALPDEEWERRMAVNPVFVSFDGATPVGMMGLMPQLSRRMAHRATLVMVYLRAANRGQGRAEALLAAVLEEARTRGIRQMELHASAENPTALRFYERMGFRHIGMVPGGFVHEGREIDEVAMARRIDREPPALR